MVEVPVAVLKLFKRISRIMGGERPRNKRCKGRPVYQYPYKLLTLVLAIRTKMMMMMMVTVIVMMAVVSVVVSGGCCSIAGFCIVQFTCVNHSWGSFVALLLLLFALLQMSLFNYAANIADASFKTLIVKEK